MSINIDINQIDGYISDEEHNDLCQMFHGRLNKIKKHLIWTSNTECLSSLNKNKLIGQDQAKSILVNKKIW